MVTHEIYKTTDANGRPVYHLPEDVTAIALADRRIVVLGDVPAIDPDDVSDVDALIQALDDEGVLVEVIPSAKMSKSKKNVVDPMHIIASFGADTARWFVMSDSPPERDVEWTASGAEATSKHLARVWTLSTRIGDMPADHVGEGDDALRRATARAVHDVTQGIEGFAFNKAIAKLYEFTNTLARANGSTAVMQDAIRMMAQLMQPMTPHIAEAIWAASWRRGPVRAGALAQGRPGAADRRHGDAADPDQRQAAGGNQRAQGHAGIRG